MRTIKMLMLFAVATVGLGEGLSYLDNRITHNVAMEDDFGDEFAAADYDYASAPHKILEMIEGSAMAVPAALKPSLRIYVVNGIVGANTAHDSGATANVSLAGAKPGDSVALVLQITTGGAAKDVTANFGATVVATSSADAHVVQNNGFDYSLSTTKHIFVLGRNSNQ